MPIFEYVCRRCRHRFEALVRASTALHCPACQAEDLQQQLSVFAIGGRGASREPAGSCGTCGDPRGPGSCSLD